MEQSQHPSAHPTLLQAEHRPFTVRGAKGELRRVLHCHIHISQEITITNPQVAAFLQTPAVPAEFFFFFINHCINCIHPR